MTSTPKPQASNPASFTLSRENGNIYILVQQNLTELTTGANLCNPLGLTLSMQDYSMFMMQAKAIEDMFIRTSPPSDTDISEFLNSKVSSTPPPAKKRKKCPMKNIELIEKEEATLNKPIDHL